LATDNNVEKQVSLTGFVYEVIENRIIKGIGISTGDEYYVVEMNEWGEKLSREIENDVQVTGIVTRDPTGKNHILVTGYELLYKDGEYNIIYNMDEDDAF
jgi:hypothetical protein